MRKDHLRCKECNTQFIDTIQATLHMIGRLKEEGTCQPRAGERQYGEIDIELWLKIEEVYKTDLSDDEKWWEWYRLLHPNAGDTAIDGRHHGNIKFSTIDIPRVLEVFHKMWEESSSLPKLSDEARHAASMILENTLLLMQVAQKTRKTRTNKPKKPGQQTPVSAEAPQVEPSVAAEAPHTVAADDPLVYYHGTEVTTADALETSEAGETLPFDEFLSHEPCHPGFFPTGLY
jgi:hypothetical protein